MSNETATLILKGDIAAAMEALAVECERRSAQPHPYLTGTIWNEIAFDFRYIARRIYAAKTRYDGHAPKYEK